MFVEKIQQDEIKIEVMEKYHLIVKEGLWDGREVVDKNGTRKWNNIKTKRTCLHTNPVQFVAIVIWISNNRLCCPVVLLKHTFCCCHDNGISMISVISMCWRKSYTLLTVMQDGFHVDFVFLVFNSSIKLIPLGIFYTRSAVYFNKHSWIEYLL